MKTNKAIAAREDDFFLGVRHLQCLLLFLGLGVGYAMRVNLSVAIVAMTDRNASNPNFEEFSWSKQTKSYVLSSFFLGYVVTQIPVGYFADKYGPKSILLGGILLSTLLAFLTPLCVRFGDWKLFCFVRFVQGLSQGVLFPSTHAVLSKWALVEERGALCGFCYAGSLFGSAVMFAISGFIAASRFGWPGVFYVSGVMGFCWTILWSIWGANTPNHYSSISQREKALIESSLATVNSENNRKPLVMTTPWTQIFTTPAVWVLIFVHCAHNWGFWTLLTELPTYMNGIFGTDMKSNALLSAMPYMAMVLLSFLFSYISNKLARSVSPAINRKVLNTIGQWIPAITLVLLAYTESEQLIKATILLILTVGMNAASFSGFQVNHIDLSPNFSGILVGITNSAANVMSVLAPLLVGFIVTDEHDPAQWRVVFFIAAGFYFFGNLIFLIFGKGNVQSWNAPESTNSTQDIELQNLKPSP